MIQRLSKNSNLYKKIVIFLVVSFCLFLSINYYVQSRVGDKIISLTGISCTKIDINLLSGCIDLHDLQLVQNLDNTQQISLQTKKAHIHGLSYWKYWNQNRVEVKDVIFENLEVTISPMTGEEDDFSKEENTENALPEEIIVQTFEILDGNLISSKQGTKNIELDSFSTKIKKLQYFPERDSAQIKWGTTEFFGKNLKINSDENYQFFIDEIDLAADKTLNISELKRQPKRSKENFVRLLPCRKSRLSISIPQLSIYPFSVTELLFENKFKANMLVVENLNLEVFSDKNKEACTEVKKYFYEKLAEADLQIDLDSIAVKNSKITFEELGTDEEEIGTLVWDKVYASIFDLTNIRETRKANTYMAIQAHFIDDSQVKVNFTFPNFNSNNQYSFDGTLNQVELNKLNRFLSFSRLLRIKTGKLKNLSFRGEGNLKSSAGSMQLSYKNLNVSLLKKDGSSRKLLSVLSNILIANKNNPNKNNKNRIGKMYAERNLQKSFISNWWMTLQSGMKSTILPNVLLPDELDVEK